MSVEPRNIDSSVSTVAWPSNDKNQDGAGIAVVGPSSANVDTGTGSANPNKADNPLTQPSAIIGCMLDASYNMKRDMERIHSRDPKTRGSVHRLRAAVRTTLTLALREQKRNNNAFMFVGMFGMKEGCGSVVDLCSIVESFMDAGDDGTLSGHEILLKLINPHKITYITERVTTHIRDHDARIVHAFLHKNQDRIKGFVDVIPAIYSMKTKPVPSTKQQEVIPPNQESSHGTKDGLAGLTEHFKKILGGSKDAPEPAAPEHEFESDTSGYVETNNYAVDERVDMLCSPWWGSHTRLTPRPVQKVVALLKYLLDLKERPQMNGNQRVGNEVVDLLRVLTPYMYGGRQQIHDPWRRVSEAFSLHRQEDIAFYVQQRTLLLIIGGTYIEDVKAWSPWVLKNAGVVIATAYLTDNKKTPPGRQLYTKPLSKLSRDERTLWHESRTTWPLNQPLRVLEAVGWSVPHPDASNLFAQVNSETALEEFLSICLSAPDNASDALFDLLGRFNIDMIVDKSELAIRDKPLPLTPAHATACSAWTLASVIHLALLSIPSRQRQTPNISEINHKIMDRFPDGRFGPPDDVCVENKLTNQEFIETVLKWYPQLNVRKVTSNEARKALDKGRPVYAVLAFSAPSWSAFNSHFSQPTDPDTAIYFYALKGDHKAIFTPRQLAVLKAGYTELFEHAAIVYRHDVHSLGFLNTWGRNWGDEGIFRMAASPKWDVSGPDLPDHIEFYDVSSWDETDETIDAREVAEQNTERARKVRAANSAYDYEASCPNQNCLVKSPISEFSGSLRLVRCPHCRRHFTPTDEYFVKGLYAMRGFDEKQWFDTTSF